MKLNKTITNKSSDDELNYEEDLDLLQNTETVHFEEDDNVIEIAVQEVDQTQFMSDDDGSEQDENSETSEIEEGEVMENTDASTANSPDRRIVKPKASQRSMEQKIEEQNNKLQEMSSTLKTMQEMMLKHEGFESGKGMTKTKPK